MNTSSRAGRPRGERCRGHLVRSARREMGLTMAQLAEQAGITERTLRKVEGGGPVSRSSLLAVAPLVGFELDELVDNRGSLAERLATAGLVPPRLNGTYHQRAGVQRAIGERLSRHRRVCLAGPPGIGATSSAAAWVATHAPASVAWVDASGLSGASGADAVETRLSALLDVPPPDAADVWTALATAHPGLIIVFDDVVSRGFLGRLPHDSAPRIVVTTHRRAIAERLGDATFDLAPMDDDAVVSVLEDALGRSRIEADRDATKRLLGLIEGCPWAAQAAARRLERRRFVPVDDIGAHTGSVWGDTTLSGMSPVRILRELSDDARATLLVMARQRAACTMDELVAASRRPAADIARAVSLLHERYLLTTAGSTGTRRFALSPGVRGLLSV